MNFIDLGLSEPILDGLRDVGFAAPTKIQEESIIPVLSGRDIIASSETGTGKTGAFVIPILEKLSKNPTTGVRCLILTPTRELANQIDVQVTVIGYYSGINSATVFGGTDGGEFGVQERALRTDGANMIIATPGRLLDHIKMGHVDFSKVEILVLDEADRMLDMGFMPDVQKIVAQLPTNRQNILFSATIPDTLNHFFQAITNDAVRVDCSVARTAKGIRQIAYRVSEANREAVLIDIISKEDVVSAIVFTRTKRDADHIFKRLMKAKIQAGVIHGDREQAERELMLAAFKSGQIHVLVATDVIARGIDINEVSHVINFQVPNEPEDYIHRIGRTARGESKGTAITLVGPKELRALDRIKKHVKTDIEEIQTEGANDEVSADDSPRRGAGRKPSSRTKTHQTTTDGEAASSTSESGDTKAFIRTSTTSRKELAEKNIAEGEKPAAKSAVAKKIATKKVVKVDEDGNKVKAKSSRKSSSDSEKTNAGRNKIKLVKREEMQSRFDAVGSKPGFFDKIKRIFGFGKK